MSESARLFFGTVLPSILGERPHLVSCAASLLQLVIEKPDGSAEALFGLHPLER
jgi:hypothetical protein